MKFLKVIALPVILFVVLIAACGGDDGPGDEPRGVAGTFTISGQSDHSGITVSVYSVDVVEAVLRTLKNRFPQNGPVLSPELRFNHREFSSLASTTSGADGSWELSGIDRNSSYILVAEHPAIGFAYFFDVQGTNDLTRSLVPRITLTGNSFAQNLVFNNQVVDIVGNVFVDNASQINITGHCFFNFDGNNSLTSRAQFTVAAGARLTLLNGGTGNAELEFENTSSVSLQNLSVFERVEVIMNNSVYAITESAFLAPNTNSLRMINGTGSLRNVLFHNQQIAIDASQIDSLSASRLIFSGNFHDVAISNSSFADFSDNLFYNGGLNLEYISTNGNVSYNHFESSINNVIIADISTVTVENNHFESNDKNLWLQQISHGQPDVIVDVHFNNFVATQTYAVQLENGTIPDSLDAVNNFWNSTLEPDIQNIIYDKNDNPNGSNSLKYVKFKPFEFQAVPTAGIR